MGKGIMGKTTWLRQGVLLLGVFTGIAVSAADVPELSAKRASGAVRIDG